MFEESHGEIIEGLPKYSKVAQSGVKMRKGAQSGVKFAQSNIEWHKTVLFIKHEVNDTLSDICMHAIRM